MKYVILFLLAIALPTVVTACRQETGYGMLVGEYSNGATTLRFRTRILLPAPENNYRFNYELQSGDKVCSLTGELDIKEIPVADECAGTRGRGKIFCGNAWPMKIHWSMSSCESGVGRSMGHGKAKFFFGYASNKERAQDQLAKITDGEN